jgi:threonine dehydrogenase-like Zn-dependent dehydrogenase
VGKGSFGEYARVLESKLALKPANLTFEQAAVVPISGRTAQQGVRDHGRVQAGQRVLITGASGGVGTYLVQLVKAYGAEVTAECSTTKLDLVRSLGADHVVDYTHEDFAAGGRSTTSFSISAVTRRCLGYGPRWSPREHSSSWAARRMDGGSEVPTATLAGSSSSHSLSRDPATGARGRSDRDSGFLSCSMLRRGCPG